MKHKNDYILWMGSLLKISDLEKGLTASTAAVRWQTGLAEGLLNKNIDINCINKPSGAYWPKGPLVLGRKNAVFFRNINGIETRFLNLPKIRTYLMSHAYSRAFKRTIKNFGLPKIAIFYNITAQNKNLFYQLKYKYRVPCLILAADIPSKNHNEYDIYKNACADANGVIYLSSSEYLKSTVNNKMHLDGGISRDTLEKRLGNVPESKPYLMYTGAFEGYCGVNLIIDALEHTNYDFKIVICGNCNDNKLLTKFNNNPLIEYKGFVSEEELEDLSRHAMGFINSYLPSAPECDGKFPSKLFEYLSYGHPVISTMTSGMAPEYKNILLIVDSESPSNMAIMFNLAYKLYASGNHSYISKSKNFLVPRTWDSQAERFLEFIKNNIN